MRQEGRESLSRVSELITELVIIAYHYQYGIRVAIKESRRWRGPRWRGTGEASTRPSAGPARARPGV